MLRPALTAPGMCYLLVLLCQSEMTTNYGVVMVVKTWGAGRKRPTAGIIDFTIPRWPTDSLLHVQSLNMSLFPDNGPLRAQFNRVVWDIADDDEHDIEWKTAGFWQVLLQSVFRLDQNYCVTAEAGPAVTASFRRVDIVVYQCLTGNFLLPVLVVEVKKPSGNIVEAEYQVLDASTTLINRISAFGARFRGFTQGFAGDPRDLATLHLYDTSASRIGSRDDYLDVNTPDGGSMLRGFIRMVKQHPPALRPVRPGVRVPWVTD
ncbi:hypothetical protein B0H66DRAFT_593161 [Apodospora peruviana]|uniref:Uncharacterized protein n=1 Tax=Apodospora peruviana TaxID=516989 RepID=A0AAE0M2N7_9PEZI|nr:hypothetical protein B0H66DRAFT_593161 [Apodospora peruviana]